MSDNLDDVPVDCTRIKDNYDLLKKAFFKPHIILAHDKTTKDKKLLVRVKTDTFKDEQRKAFIRVMIMMCKNHKLPAMVKFDKIIQDGLDVCLVQHFNQFGTLKDLMKTAASKDPVKPFSESIVKNWIAYLLIAVHALHQRKILHGFLHAGNLYMDEKALHVGPIEGFSRILEDPKSFSGSRDAFKSIEMEDIERVNYLTPEQIAKKLPGPATDIWCIGVLSHFMATMTFPFQGSQVESVSNRIIRNNPNFFNFEAYRFSEDLKTFILRCLDKDPESRPSSTELVECPYMKDVISSIMPQLKSEK